MPIGFFVIVVVLNSKSIPCQVPLKVMFSLTVLLNNLSGHLPAIANAPGSVVAGGTMRGILYFYSSTI